jgi:hypothetical protein
MSVFHSSQHWADTYVTGGFTPHIRFGGFLLIIRPRLNTTILWGLSTITSYYNVVLHNININKRSIQKIKSKEKKKE